MIFILVSSYHIPPSDIIQNPERQNDIRYFVLIPVPKLQGGLLFLVFVNLQGLFEIAQDKSLLWIIMCILQEFMKGSFNGGKVSAKLLGI